MKKTIALLTISFCTILAKAQNNLTLHASIKGMEAGQWVYWNPLTNSLQLDSVKTTAGGFQIDMHIPEGEGDAYMVKLGKKYTENSMMLLYMDKGTIELKGEGPLFKDAKFSGTRSVQDYNDYKDFTEKNPVLKGRSELYKKANELYAKKDSAGLAALDPELKKMDSTDNASTKQWIRQHPASPISAFLLSFNLGRLSLDEKEAILAQLSPAAKDNAPAKRIANSVRINNLTGIGKTALDFTQNDTLGKPVSLKDFRGKYVLVDFWASWCVPCRGENPNVVAAFNKYKDKNFTVISVSLDQPNGKEKWLKAIHDDHLDWTHVSDLKYWNNAVARQYDINSIPSNLLLDPDGKIIAKDLHGEELSNELAKLLP
jgi:peroxiredoxin